MGERVEASQERRLVLRSGNTEHPVVGTDEIARGVEEKLVAVRAVGLSEDHPDRASGGFCVRVRLACWDEIGGKMTHPMHMFVEYRMYWTSGKFQIAEKKTVLE